MAPVEKRPCIEVLIEILYNYEKNQIAKPVSKIEEEEKTIDENLPLEESPKKNPEIIKQVLDNNDDFFQWDTSKFGGSVKFSNNNLSANLKETAYIFRTIIGNKVKNL